MYVSEVICRELWPSFSCTTLMSFPTSNERLAEMCRASWRRVGEPLFALPLLLRLPFAQDFGRLQAHRDRRDKDDGLRLRRRWQPTDPSYRHRHHALRWSDGNHPRQARSRARPLVTTTLAAATRQSATTTASSASAERIAPPSVMAEAWRSVRLPRTAHRQVVPGLGAVRQRYRPGDHAFARREQPPPPCAGLSR